VIGGRDQRTDEEAVATITDAEERDGVLWLRSDASACYEGAESVVRELVLVRPHEGTGRWGYVIVRDLARTRDEETFEFMLQPGGVSGDTFTITCEGARLFGKVLAPSGVSMEVLPGIGEHVNVKNPRTLRIAAPGKAKQVEFLVALAPLAEGESVPEIALRAVQVGSDVIAFSPDGKAAPKKVR